MSNLGLEVSLPAEYNSRRLVTISNLSTTQDTESTNRRRCWFRRNWFSILQSDDRNREGNVSSGEVRASDWWWAFHFGPEVQKPPSILEPILEQAQENKQYI